MKSNIQEIKKKILDSEVVSFDIFDTLFFRIVNKPEDIFLIMEEQLHINDFSKIRVDGQHNASLEINNRYQFPHANIDEIYYYISQHNDLKDVNWNEVKLFEIQLELDSVIPNKEMFELFEFAKSNNKRVIATSDMYLNKIQIEKMLERCGYSGFDYLYISADERHTKYNGDLFDAVIESENISANKIVHIGDNKKDDYEIAISKGLKACQYVSNHQPNKKCELTVCKSLAEGISRVLANFNEEDDFWYYLGSKVGGNLYLGLMNWVIDTIKDKKYDNIYFLSRDGFILYNVFKSIGYKNIHYLFTSRRSLLLAGITELDEEALENLPPYTYGQTVEEILEYLDFTNIDEVTIQKSGLANKKSIIRTQKDISKMKNLFRLCEDYILEKCAIERENVKKYFNSIGILESNAICFDCGWNGSSQYLLDKVLEAIGEYKGRNEFLYVGILENDKSYRQLKNKSYKTYLFGKGQNKEIAQSVISNIVLLELFFGAPHDSVWRYGIDGPELENIELRQDHKEKIYHGIQDYLKIAKPFLERYNVSITVNDAISEILRLIQDPSEKEAVEIGNLSNVDGFANQKNFVKYIAKLNLYDIVKNPKIEVYWPQGLIRRNDVGWTLKYFISKRYHLSNHNPLPKMQINNHNYDRMQKGLRMLIKEGPLTLLYHIKKRKQEKRKNIDIYTQWILENEKEIFKTEPLEYEPLISIIVPVYNVLRNQLEECIESVLSQTYKKWELCLVDDASTWNEVKTTLKTYENTPHVNIIYRRENGHISRATNSGIKIAKGDFIAFLDCDDILSPNALYEMAKKVNENSEYDFIYSDEDKLSADGTRRHSPFFKPDWSPDSFMSLMYTCHFAMYRSLIVNEIKGLRVGFEGAQDYDFTLRFVEKARNIGHISKILYHWREREESLASNPESKPYALSAVKRCKEEALTRRGLNGEVAYVPDMYQYRVNYISKEPPKVSVIIISFGDIDNLTQCINSIIEETTYKNYEIIVVYNSVDKEEVKTLELCKKNGCKYVKAQESFEISALYNEGKKYATGSFLLFLMEHIVVGSPEWLDILVGQCELGHIGAVGTKIIYNNTDKIKHCGIVNLESSSSFSFHGFNDQYCYYYGRNRMDYNCFAVSGGCLMVRKDKFENIGGFSKEYNNVILCDIDLCKRLLEKGYYNVVKNNIVLYTNERYEASKRVLETSFNIQDPFYNPNLTAKGNFDIRINVDNQVNRMNKISRQNIEKLKKHNVVGVVDSIRFGNIIKIEGWAFLEHSICNNMNKIRVILIDEEGSGFTVDTNSVYRPDVTNAFNNRNLNLTGFQCFIDKKQLSERQYKVGISVNDILGIRKGLLIFGKTSIKI